MQEPVFLHFGQLQPFGAEGLQSLTGHAYGTKVPCSVKYAALIPPRLVS